MQITDLIIEKYTRQIIDVGVEQFKDLGVRMGLVDASIREIVRELLDRQYTRVDSKNVVRLIDAKFADCSYSKLIDMLTEEDDHWNILGPQPEALVDSVEAELRLTFPSSFKRYLREVGGMNLGDSYLPSLGSRNHAEWLSSPTTQHIKLYGLPEGFFVIHSDHDNPVSSCLDLRMMENSDCPVVYYNKYDRVFNGVAATSFDIWFRHEIKVSIATAIHFREEYGKI